MLWLDASTRFLEHVSARQFLDDVLAAIDTTEDRYGQSPEGVAAYMTEDLGYDGLTYQGLRHDLAAADEIAFAGTFAATRLFETRQALLNDRFHRRFTLENLMGDEQANMLRAATAHLNPGIPQKVWQAIQKGVLRTNGKDVKVTYNHSNLIEAALEGGGGFLVAAAVVYFFTKELDWPVLAGATTGAIVGGLGTLKREKNPFLLTSQALYSAAERARDDVRAIHNVLYR